MNRAHWLAVPLISLALVACGSSDDGGSGTSPDTGSSGSSGSSDPSSESSSAPLSESELVAEADKICQDASDKIKSIPQATSLEEVQESTSATRKVSDEATAKLESLAAPESIKPDYDAYLKIVERVNELSSEVAVAGAQDPSKIQTAVTELLKEGAETRRLAEKIGFEKCGRSAVSALPALPQAPEAP